MRVAIVTESSPPDADADAALCLWRAAGDPLLAPCLWRAAGDPLLFGHGRRQGAARAAVAA
ncbi:hypothetical protein [Peterkaempfera sp. SMS 1(5)a]|uniref:hypothetical protein n=1 Tax=Peterkaempfera podocarpi TaxID=3232308 RepID=UPI003671894B